MREIDLIWQMTRLETPEFFAGKIAKAKSRLDLRRCPVGT